MIWNKFEWFKTNLNDLKQIWMISKQIWNKMIWKNKFEWWFKTKQCNLNDLKNLEPDICRRRLHICMLHANLYDGLFWQSGRLNDWKWSWNSSTTVPETNLSRSSHVGLYLPPRCFRRRNVGAFKTSLESFLINRICPLSWLPCETLLVGGCSLSCCRMIASMANHSDIVRSYCCFIDSSKALRCDGILSNL